MPEITNVMLERVHSISILIKKFAWERFLLIVLVLISPVLIFYNLDINPRIWHDEGSILSVPKTLAEDGVYATKNGEEYQTFGPIQSAGPTVVLPIALVFKKFGVGVLQGRIVVGVYALLTLFFFYLCAYELFGRRVALFSSFILLGAPAAGFLIFSRYVLGDIPALGFFLAGCYVWAKGNNTKAGIGYPVLVGCLFGAAIITKTQYLLIVFVAAIFLIVLDLIYFKQYVFKYIAIVLVTSGIWFSIWTTWQIRYFGADVYAANTQKFRELAVVTTGFDIHTTIQALRFVFGSGSGYLFIYWGLFSVIYVLYLSVTRKAQNPALLFLFIVLSLWVGYFVFWSIPWQSYFIVPGTILSLFVGKLVGDLVMEIGRGWDNFMESAETKMSLAWFGNVVAVGTLLLFSLYQLQTSVRLDVLDKIGNYTGDFRKPPEFSAPYAMAKYINEHIESDAVIETWERELGILTNNVYHYPDQSMLIHTHASVYRNAPVDYSLGKEYFDEVRPDYVINGWYGRQSSIYDLDFLNANADLIATIGSADYGYDVYKLHK